MRRAALLILGTAALLLTPGAPGLPDIEGDPTPPVVAPVISGTLGTAGWYTSNVTVNWSVTDPESIILSTSGCDARTLSTDTLNTRLTCAATSDGGETTVSKTLKVDKTAPASSAVPSRGADENGWYNHELSVGFAGSDSTSGLESCSGAQSYGGPDTSGGALNGTCRDIAGNVAPVSFTFKYDETPPQASPAARAPDTNGWYNHALTVTYQGADGTSGVAGCTETTYAGPDDPSVALAGTCTDRAGNESGASVLTLKYDETAPQATATASRAADQNGWYNHPVTVSFIGDDATAGLDSCDPPTTYVGPDAASTSVMGACRDRAGNIAPRGYALKYDATPPQATATPSRQANPNGWRNAPVTVTFAGTDATAGVDTCDPARSYSGPDTASTTLTGACRDKAGNTGGASLALKYDATAPQVVAAASRPPNANGWHNAALTVSFSGTDATAGIDSCDAAKTYSGPDAAAATISGSCRDKAGNGGGSSLTLKFDATKPQVTAAADRAADANGWFNAPVTVGFTGGDATSGVAACDAAARYAGPDSATTSITGTCRDKADNVGSGSFPLKYDATAPQAVAAPSRPPNASGWHNAPFEVSFTASDSVSGLESCPQPKSYAGPDTASGVVSGTCLDRAGNGAPASFALKYDATAPVTTASSREPDGNGWYRRPLTITFGGTDATSGVAACSAPRDYLGPDTATGASKGLCRDHAGNESTQATFGFKYDATAPQVTEALAVRPPDRLDWYTRPIVFAVQGTDGTSGLDTCSPVTYAGPDSGAAAVTGSCVDKAGNSGARSFALRFDGTGPEARAIANRAPDANDWYRAPITVSFAGEDAVSGLDSCDAPTGYDGPDSAVAELAGVCIDRAGNASVASLPLHFDATAPQVTTVSPERPPDANGWYNRRLAVSFHGADATSGIDTCTEASYAGPDAGAVSLGGLCRDVAGNTSAGASFALRYDATPPRLAAVRATPGNRTITLSWMSSPDTTGVEIRRSGKLVYHGSGLRFTETGLQNGTLYRYTLTASDEAWNAADYAVTARPSTPLVSPPAGAKVSEPPLLVWRSVPNATYYNVQVWRRGRILSTWPTRTSFRLSPTWTYGGRRHKLLRGRYRWYVWPGYGRKAARRFGPLLGSSSFVVR